MMPKEGRNGGALLARALQRKRNADRISFSALAGASLQRLMLRTLPATLNTRSQATSCPPLEHAARHSLVVKADRGLDRVKRSYSLFLRGRHLI